MRSTKTRSATLSDTQLVILSAAAQRDDRCAAQPESMGAAAFTRATKQLLARGLLEEVAPEEGRARRAGSKGMRITALGLEAIGVGTDTTTALEGVQQQPARARKRQAPRPAAPARVEPAVFGPAPIVAAVNDDAGPSRRGTKRAQVVRLLLRPGGASSADLIAATGWLPHTTRAALTGLRQSGYTIEREKGADGRTVYRIVGGTAAGEAA